MRRPRRTLLLSFAVAVCLTAAGPVTGRTPPQGEPPASTAPPAVPADGVVNVFVNTPADLNVLWKSLAKPDFVILRGDEYARLKEARPGPGTAAHTRQPVVESVLIRGRVEGALATLTVEMRISQPEPATAWVPVRLDGLTLTGASENGRVLPLRSKPGSPWEVEVSGNGPHMVNVSLVTEVRRLAGGKRVELPIPEAASTRLQVDVPQTVEEAAAGPSEPVARDFRKDTGLTRLSAELSPRSRLTLDWKTREEPTSALPPLLVLRQEVAIDVDADSFRIRSSCSIRSHRGAASTLRFQLDPRDELLDVELDGETAPAGVERAKTESRLTLNLDEPLTPGQELRLIINARRPATKGDVVAMDFRGFPLLDADEQSGAIGVAQGTNLFLSATAGRGVRRIDPRTELPAVLRARPGTVLAFQFSEQPFELTLRAEPSPPLARAGARTNVLLEPGLARVGTLLDYEITRGRIEELTLSIPPGLEVESVGPAELVTSWQCAPGNGERLLTARIIPRSQDGTRFSLQVVARQAVGAGPEQSVGMIRPVGLIFEGGRLAVYSDPGQSVELGADPGRTSATELFRPIPGSLPPDWPAAPGRFSGALPSLWVRHADAQTLPLRVDTHPLELTEATSLAIRVDPAKTVVHQETELSVRYGSLDRVDFVVPQELEGLWEIEGPGVASTSRPNVPSTSARVLRLKLQGELTRSVRLRFRYELAAPAKAGAAASRAVSVPWLRPVLTRGESAPLSVRLTAGPGVRVATTGTGWSGIPQDVAASGIVEESEPVECKAAGEPGAVSLRVTPLNRFRLPEVVVPRLAVRTILTPEGRIRSTAWFSVETRSAALRVALPPGALPEAARVAGQVLPQVTEIEDHGGYSIPLPAAPAGAAVPVELDYSCEAGPQGQGWGPPTFLEGAVVQETCWVVRLPWSQALVGTPAGWSDENEWYWDLYLWKRRPLRPTPDLAAWARGGPSGGKTLDVDESAGDYHGYLFSRPGGPAGMRPLVLSRALLLGLCSGVALGLGGCVVLFWRPSFGVVWLAFAGFGVAVGCLIHPSVTFLVLQSSSLGLFLTAVLGMIHRVVERRRPRPVPFPEAGSAGTPVPGGSTVNRVVGVGSDDSTAIRARPSPVSTLDYHPAPGLMRTPEPHPDDLNLPAPSGWTGGGPGGSE